jgi:hypothetical protein
VGEWESKRPGSISTPALDGTAVIAMRRTPAYVPVRYTIHFRSCDHSNSSTCAVSAISTCTAGLLPSARAT